VLPRGKGCGNTLNLRSTPSFVHWVAGEARAECAALITSLRVAACAVPGVVSQWVQVPPGKVSRFPAGSNPSGGRGNEAVGALGGKGQSADSASQRAVTRVNTEQAPKPSDAGADPVLRRGRPPEATTNSPGAEYPEAPKTMGRFSGRSKGDGTLATGNHATREACLVAARDGQPDAREGQAGPGQVAERPVVPPKPGNAGGGKGPWFGWMSNEVTAGDWCEPTNS
jgi:hypothetical protein